MNPFSFFSMFLCCHLLASSHIVCWKAKPFQ
jgi:hypothetical protein